MIGYIVGAAAIALLLIALRIVFDRLADLEHEVQVLRRNLP